MNVRILTDRALIWQAALGHRNDVVVGKSLEDSSDKDVVLIVDGVKNPDRVATWVNEVSPLAVLMLIGSGGPGHLLMDSLRDHFSGRVAIRQLVAESYGSLTVWHGSIAVFAHKLQSEPAKTHGPGVRDSEGRPVFWDRLEDWENFGIPVSRDDPSVIQSIYQATSGNQPLWVQPGFPAVIPNQPQTYRSLSGAPVSGILCSARDPLRVGGWDVLELSDVARLLGYPPHLFSTWSDLTSTVPRAGAQALVKWALRFNPSLGSV